MEQNPYEAPSGEGVSRRRCVWRARLRLMFFVSLIVSGFITFFGGGIIDAFDGVISGVQSFGLSFSPEALVIGSALLVGWFSPLIFGTAWFLSPRPPMIET